MGFETHAILYEARDAIEICQKIIEGFLVQGWTIVRENGNCFSVAYKDRLRTEWDEDFMICITERVYMVEHSRTPKSTSDIHKIIEQSLGYTYPYLTWEEV